MIKQPVYAPNAVPTPYGWLEEGRIVHEVALTPEQIKEWCDANGKPQMQMLNEVPSAGREVLKEGIK